jgi:hypothetical protein
MTGQIEVKSLPGKGSRFRVTLPLKVTKGDSSIAMMTSPTNSRFPGSPDMDDKNKSFSDSLQSMTSVTSTTEKAVQFRSKGRKKNQGEKLKSLRIIIIEDELTQDDAQLVQVLNQLKQTGCLLIYSTSANSLAKLKELKFKVDAIVIISSNSSSTTKKFTKALLGNLPKPIPYIIATGILVFIYLYNFV